VRLNPQLRDAQFSIGTIYLRLGDYDRAIAAFQEVVRIDPQYAPAHYNLGSIYMERGNDPEALVHFEEALKNPSPQLDLKEAEGFVAFLKKKLNQ